MSDNERNIHDPIIETVEESDNENEVAAHPPVVDHADPMQCIETFNGESLLTTGSPFKKMYSGSSMEEASVGSLVDEPLPIESVALSPFRMDSIHNSPLPNRRKDSHPFSVSVSDSLPPHVMELDSPEHSEDRPEEPDEEEEEATLSKGSQNVEDFMLAEKAPCSSNSQLDPATLPDVYSSGNVDTDHGLALSEDLKFRRQEGLEWAEDSATPSFKAAIALSQQDMFESQPLPGNKGHSPLGFPGTLSRGVDRAEDAIGAPCVGREVLSEGEEGKGNEEKEVLLFENDIIPPTGSQRSSKSVTFPFGEAFQNRSPCHPSTTSPVKRKRESIEDESKEAWEAKVLKISAESGKETEEGEDSDIEVVSESRSANQSIEVLFDGKGPVSSAGCIESQDLDLCLTEDTQSFLGNSTSTPQVGVPNLSDEKSRKNDSSPSQSLLSMPDSTRLTCEEVLSSSEGNLAGRECTIGATQVEELCPPASPLPSEPNVKSLIQSPLRTNSPRNQSTNSHIVAPVEVNLDEKIAQENLEGESCSQSQPLKEVEVSYPQFETQSQETRDDSESLFHRVSKAVDKKKEEEEKEREREKELLKQKAFLEEFSNKKSFIDCSLSPSDETVEKMKEEFSNSSCAIQSHDSTPNSSQSLGELSSHRLFSNSSQENSRRLEESSQILAEDSDDEGSKLRNLHCSNASLKGLSNSTPNDSTENPVIPLSSEGPSSIKSVPNSFDSPVDQLSSTSKDICDADTEKVENESDSVHCVKDLVQRGWIKQGILKVSLPLIERWKNPITSEVIFSVLGEDVVLKDAMPIESLLAFSSPFHSDTSSKDSRISNFSSISRITSSSSGGYLGDRSGSSNQSVAGFDFPRAESSRLSMASVSTISPPHPNQAPVFLPPHPPKISAPTSAMVSVETQTEPHCLLDTPRRGKGRGRPRGKGRARGRSMGGRGIRLHSSIEEEEEKIFEASASTKTPTPSPPQEEEDNFLALLPKEIRENLRKAQIPLTDDEEELFILQKDATSAEAQSRQYEQVVGRVRVAEIRPNTLVFAMYFDKNYYSAIVIRSVDNKWEVQYNLDSYKNVVRTLYILPTDILPKGLSCHVRNPNRNYSEPGLVKGHIYQDGTLIHLVEVHEGKIVKATHSHIILSSAVADDLMKRRISFNSMIASPGRDVSLDNVVPGKRRSDASPTKAIGYSPGRKPDSNLDTSSDVIQKLSKTKSKNNKQRGSPKSSRLPVAFSDSSNDTDVSFTPKSTRRRIARKLATPKTTRSGTPRTPSTRTPLRKGNKDPSPAPESEVLSPSKSGEPLMNPVVELIQLQEVAASPKTTPKKRGRKPGSGRKGPKKIMKVDPESSSEDEEEDFSEMAPELGPLPPKGCQIFKGYSILITHAVNSAETHRLDEDDKPRIPLDKVYLREQITRAGGEVIDHFDDAHHLHIQIHSKKNSHKRGNVDSLKTLPASASPAKVVCVSNYCCRTAKFIQCLTVGIPLVNIEWIISSLKMGQCLNWLHFLLPAGVSLSGNHMEQTCSDFLSDASSSSLGRGVDVLKNERVFLATSSKPAFSELWLQLLSAANAVVFTMPPKGGNIQRLIDRRTGVVIADSSIPQAELNRARDLNVPVVSSEWFIQSLINCRKLPYDAYEQFRYDFNKVNEEGGEEEEEEEEEQPKKKTR